jgi:hypothetical protein
VSSTELTQLKTEWNAVLDQVLAMNRIAWLAFFDARLVSLDGSKLTLAWQDSEKFGGQHDFQSVRNPEHTKLLLECIKSVTGLNLEIIEE